MPCPSFIRLGVVDIFPIVMFKFCASVIIPFILLFFIAIILIQNPVDSKFINYSAWMTNSPVNPSFVNFCSYIFGDTKDIKLKCIELAGLDDN